jgi:spore coat protein CotF
MMDNNIQIMGDKEIINDSIGSQKLIGSSYNTFANECSNTDLRNDFLNILREEHDIQTDLFREMQRRGWYNVQQAPQNQIQQTRQKYMTM